MFALRAEPSCYLIRSLRLIVRHKYQFFFICTVLIPRMRLRNPFLMLVLLFVNVLMAKTYFLEPAGWFLEER